MTESPINLLHFSGVQFLTPLLSTVGGGSSSNSLWGKLKHGTQQIVGELTAPPTVGAVSSLAQLCFSSSRCHHRRKMQKCV
jgi:hypothetical protein